MIKKTFIFALVLLAQSVHAETMVRQSPYSYEDTRDEIIDAVISRGLVVSYHSHISDMLERTSDAVGNGSNIASAEGIFFCQAALTHELLQEDIHNIVNCPYGVYIYQGKDDGAVNVSYRKVEGDSPAVEQVNALLADIVQQVIE